MQNEYLRLLLIRVSLVYASTAHPLVSQQLAFAGARLEKLA